VLGDAGIAPTTAHQRAEEAIALIQGALVLTRGLNDPKIFERILNQMPNTLLRPEL
jgi:TetR/AcrR family transcriptional regulator, lmrAB and yxaGH operons repressor